MKLNLTLSLVALTLTSACGFQPMYGTYTATTAQTGASTEAALSNVKIGNIPNREGVYLRNALIDRFYKKGYPVAPEYTLSFTHVTERLIDLDITKSAEATRGQVILKTDMTLTRTADPAAPVLQRSLTSVTSYNILGSEFATRVTEDNARLSGLDELARQAELQVSLFLNRDMPRETHLQGH